MMIETPVSSNLAVSKEGNDNKAPLEKHPLQHTWAFWYLRQDKGLNWEDCLKEVATFDTVEDFWAIYNHIELPSKLTFRCDYNFFKNGIKPLWEDKSNMSGGHWEFDYKRYDDSQVDDYWMDLLLLMIGEGFDEYADKINGAVIQMRPKNKRISLWVGDVSDDKAVVFIGKKIRERLNLPSDIPLNFRVHSKQYAAAMTHDNRFRNEQFLYTC